MAHVNYSIRGFGEDVSDLVCNSCQHVVRATRENLKGWLMGGYDPATNPLTDKCPNCGAPYEDYAPNPVFSALNNEFVRFGTTISEVMKHLDEDPVALDSNIGFILLDKEERAGLGSFTAGERSIYVIQAMTREVNNGGFDQFFYNSSGRQASDLLPALEAIGSVEFLGIAKKAIDRLGSISNLSDASRAKRLCELEKVPGFTWQDLDDEFYGCEEQLEPLCLRFIRQHPEFFA
jgi:rubredoxin